MKKFLCFFGFHEYFVIQQLTERAQKLGCDRCGKRFAVLHDMQSIILPWSESIAAFYKQVFGIEVKS